jgi:hypothetical protein
VPDARAKTIQIYLPDGNARGVRVAEVTSRTVQAVQIPRSELTAAAERDEVQRVGLYVLVGDTDDEAGKPVAYVGEAENCVQRLARHHRRRDVWNTAIVVTSKTRSFTEDHAFDSPSGAAGVVLGRQANGWREWTDADGQSLDELERC